MVPYKLQNQSIKLQISLRNIALELDHILQVEKIALCRTLFQSVGSDHRQKLNMRYMRKFLKSSTSPSQLLIATNRWILELLMVNKTFILIKNLYFLYAKMCGKGYYPSNVELILYKQFDCYDTQICVPKILYGSPYHRNICALKNLIEYNSLL